MGSEDWQSVVERTVSIFLTHHLIFLSCGNCGDALVPDDLVSTNGLFAQAGQTLALSTGIHTGYVWLTVAIGNVPPSAPELAQWDEVIETDLLGDGRVIQASTIMGGTLDSFRSTDLTEAENYRVRVHAHGRDTDVDGTAFEPVERYLIQIWPGPVGGESFHKTSDRYGAQLRRRSASE